MEYTQGYWVEFQKNRLAGGVSAEAHNLEGGLGAVYSDKHFGLTGYVEYSIPYFLASRFQLDLLTNQEWRPQLSFGVPIEYKSFIVAPHLLFTLKKDYPHNPKAGLRVQFVF